MIPLCQDQGVGVIPWSPLARSFLACNRTRDKGDAFAHSMYYQDSDFDILERAQALAKQHGVTSAQIALAWLLHRPGVTAPIIGASKMYQLDEALAALEIKLSADEIKSLEEPYRPHPVLGH